ncbi:hypothetical protein MMC29_001501 [Sticta canariensis]|nr:hypothetical protein [Sticta canariensis]
MDRECNIEAFPTVASPIGVMQAAKPTPHVIDLTDSQADQTYHANRSVIQVPSRSTQYTPRLDHMHPVVNLLQHQWTSCTAEGSSKIWKTKGFQALDPIPIYNRDFTSRHSEPSSHKVTVDKPSPYPRTHDEQTRASHGGTTLISPLHGNLYDVVQSSSFYSSSLSTNRPPSETSGKKQRKERGKATRHFPFIQLPPELRNTIYHRLLTTPNTPIEFPKLTRNAAARAAQWTKCNSASRRKHFKSIFLEILQTCKQIYDEANGILYGCNVFKFRSNYKEGPKNIVLPTRHLHLLKHVKLSVISREESTGQEGWVANLLNGFRGDEMRLDTFEMTWFGWKRFCLQNGGMVSQTLQTLHVEKHFIVKVTGEARMEKDMLLELEQNINAKEVVIYRPVKQITKGESVELSDDEVRSL